jgi:hypothetical protein
VRCSLSGNADGVDVTAVKMFFGWNNAEFNNGVTYKTTYNVAKGATQSTANTFWWRLQLFF